MSVFVTPAVWRHSLAEGNTRLVLLRLADQASDDGWCWPSHASLAADCRVSVATVKRALSDLEALGELAAWRRGRQRSNLYRVLIGTPAAPEVPAEFRTTVGKVMAQSEPSVEGGLPSSDGSPGPQVMAHLCAIQGTVIEPSLEGDTSEQVSPSRCPTVGCSKEAGHRGAHTNPWWDALGEALYPGEGIPEHQRTRAGALVARIRRAGHPPGRILEAAAWILREWGPSRLTLNSLAEHYERATSAIAQLTPAQVEEYLRGLERGRRRAALEDAYGDGKKTSPTGGLGRAEVVRLPARKEGAR